MDEGWGKKALSPKGAAGTLSRYGWILRYVPLLVVLSILSLYLRGGGVETAFGGGSGTESDPYLIATEAHLRDMAAHPLLKDRKHFLQTTDIALSGERSPIPGFNGRYDGNGHKITGLTIKNDRLTYVGLFGSIEHDGEIRDLTVETSPEGITNSTENVSSGIIADRNGGLIENCTTRGRVEDVVLAGGITAYNDGTVKNCVNHAVIASTGVCRYFSAGGIDGINSGLNNVSIRRGDGPEPSRKALLSRCTNHGQVTAAETFASCTGGITSQTTWSLIEDCSNSGPVLAEGGSSETVAGGIVGNISSLSEIFRCLNTGTVNALGRKRITVAGGVAGKDWYKVVATDSRSTVKATVKEEIPSRQGEP